MPLPANEIPGRVWAAGIIAACKKSIAFTSAPIKTILEVGCAEGHLLASLEPARGVGIDFSEEMICRAKEHHPELEFIHADAHDLSELNEKFDVIILSDLVNDLWDVQRVFEQLRPLCTAHTRIILNFYSRLWQIPLSIARRLNLAGPTLFQNWLTREDIKALLRLANFETVRVTQEILWPLPLGGFANRFLVRLWPFNETGAFQLCDRARSASCAGSVRKNRPFL